MLELLSIANNLPTTVDFAHEKVVNAYSVGDEEALRYYLERATDRLPADLMVFVRPDDTLLQVRAEGWAKALGQFLFNCAIGVSNGLLFPQDSAGKVDEGKPFFGIGELQAMRQRYLFLFAIREILSAAAESRFSLEIAGQLLRSHQDGFSSISAFGQIKAFQGRFELMATSKSSETHILKYIEPTFARVLERIEVERIQRCAVCNKFFWAGRLLPQSESACRPQHSNVLRARKWRRNHGSKSFRPRTRSAVQTETQKIAKED